MSEGYPKLCIYCEHFDLTAAYEELWSIRKRPEEIIGLCLGIDPKKLEAEKQAMLKAIRADNPRTKARIRP